MTNQSNNKNSILELVFLFLKLGAISFGGPAAHIAILEQEVVVKRKWLTREYFLDLVGATNLIPGPNSTEMAIHIGFMRAGIPGLIVSGACFILPAVLITGFFAWVYVNFGALPQIAPFFVGIAPAVLAVIVTAIWRLGKTAAKSWQIVLIGFLVAIITFLGVNEIIAMLGGGFLGMIWLGNINIRKKKSTTLLALLISTIPKSSKAFTVILLTTGLVSVAPVQMTLWKLGLFFLKIGSVLYGSGYVLIAFLEGGLVHDYGWLTQKQLLDAVAMGQFTPGPVLSTATFIGYLLSGPAGAMVATLGIFLPSFIFVALLNPIVPKLRKSIWTSAFLDSVNISSIALMAVVTIQLAQSSLIHWQSWFIALLAIAVSFRWEINTFWIILGGAFAGWILY